MKHIYTLFFASLFATGVSAQQIDSLVVSPANPTTTTPVTVYPYLTFSYTSCNTGTSWGSPSGFSINAGGFHCMGMLSAICNDVDTIALGLLPAGTYTMTYLLDGGFGLPTCSPAFVPFDTLVTTFTVSLPTGMDELQAGNFNLMPNPASGGKFTIERPKHAEGDALLLYAADGRLAQRIELHSEKETVSTSLAQGLYFAGLERNGHIGAMKKIVITH